MIWRIGKRLRVFARGASLRRRVAYSLAMVRLILVPVILLAVYYLFSMWWILDRIVSVDAPVATLAEHASISMLDARRAERSYFLLHDPSDLEQNHGSISDLTQLIETIRQLQPTEAQTTQKMLDETNLYQKRLNDAVGRMGPGSPPAMTRIQGVVRAYENDLNDLLRHANRETRAQLIQALQNQVGSLDAQIAETLVAEDPAFRQITLDLKSSSDDVIRLSSDLEKRSWERVEQDHHEARELVHRAEWVLGIVSFLTLVLSVLVSFILPREAVKPLVDLKAAVDNAAAGNYEIEFEVQGEGEVVQLANSLRKLISHVGDKEKSSGVAR